MHEILFRGKSIVDGKWAFGDFCNYDGTTHIKNKHDLFNVVTPETVGQYTGLTDKNGTKIFEGDIVEFYFYDKTRRNGELVDVKNTRTMLIEWKDSSFYMTELYRNYYLDKVVTETIFDYKGSKKQGVYQSNSTYAVEVIGNIFDNPELLKDGESK